tara:strand:+ start:33 stop:254 length:222 start_codon:yes stop_codon:yes gene_type:complete
MSESQKEIVLSHLKKNKTITSWEAIQTYRCTRLADKIFVLRQEGHEIITNNMTNKNGKRFAEYVLIKESSNVR